MTSHQKLDLAPDYEQTFAIPLKVGDYGYGFNASWFVALYNTTTLEVVAEDTADWRFVSGSGKTAEGEALAGETVPVSELWEGVGVE